MSRAPWKAAVDSNSLICEECGHWWDGNCCVHCEDNKKEENVEIEVDN